MCIPHAPVSRKAPKVHRPSKRISKERTPFNKELLKPDVSFIDERRVEKEKDKGFFAKLFN